MKFYLVGGAVRDQLLGQPIRERDWLIVDGSQQELLERGFRRVGKSFAVFLHPETGEEYALPRGSTPPAASEEEIVREDLARRDLTINAMAISPGGRLVDPLNGQEDLKARLFRHTPAFRDDPLRVLRLARMVARYKSLDFRVWDETSTLVRQIASSKAYRSLPPDRVWAEIEQVLGEDHPRDFFEFLQTHRALSPLLPELSSLFGVPQPEIYHPEIDTGVHTMMVLDQACLLTADPVTRFAALTHDLGKGSTPKEVWPGHAGHEQRGLYAINAICARFPVPNRFKSLALLVAGYHTHCHRSLHLKTKTLLETISATDAFRRPERLEQFLTACEADVRGRLGFENKDYPQAEFLRTLFRAAASVDAAAITESAASGDELPALITESRLRAIDDAKRYWNETAAPRRGSVEF